MHPYLAGFNARLKGARTYIAAVALMLPDALQQLGALDLSAIMPAELAGRAGFILAVARIMAAVFVTAGLRARGEDPRP